MVGRTRLWAVAMALSAAVAGTAVGSAAMGDGRDDSRDSRGSHDSRDSFDWRDAGNGRDRDRDRDREREEVRAKLSGFEEDPLTISTTGSGRFKADIDERDKEIEFRLSYEDLEGKVQAAHIHFGGRHQSGGIVVFLCSNGKDAPKGTQRCPDSPATIDGTIRPGDVLALPKQGIEAGAFDELVDAIEAGVTYVNVHTDKFPNGEIRGQIKSDDDRDRDKDDDDWNRDDAWSRDKDDDDHGKDKDDHGKDKDDHGKDKDDHGKDKDDHDKDKDDHDKDKGDD